MRLWKALPRCCAATGALLSLACMPLAGPEGTRFFRCEDGRTFSVTFVGDKAQVRAGSQIYDLRRRKSSVGIRYGSNTVAFAQDGSDAFLVGTPDGPYRGCRAVDPRI